MHRTSPALLALAVALVIAPSVAAQQTRTIEVSEPFGISRTQFPATARIDVARGVLRDVANARLRAVDPAADVPAQFTAQEKWDDGSVRAMDVDFNVTLGAGETRRFTLEYGDEVAGAAPGRGLTVTEDADAIQVGNLKFGRRGAPLVMSANYRGEFIGTGDNTVTVIDRNGARHDLSSATDLSVAIVKRGPLNVTLRYTGRLALDAGPPAALTVDVEMPNSKSWFRMTAAVDDPSQRVREIQLRMPLGYAAFPWTWDVGTDSNTYGAFRAATDAMQFTQRVNVDGTTGWEVTTTSGGGAERVYENSARRARGLAFGWGHILDASHAMAFAIEKFGETPGTYRVRANGTGQTSFAFIPAAPGKRHELTIVQHFVTTPVPIGAATSPAAILHPLTVSLR